jgi:hypothetical protein
MMDKSYFENYCQAGSYSSNYLFYSGIEHCIYIFDQLRLRVDSVIVLGAATGEVLLHFERAWGVRPRGCEISRWAHRRIPAPYRASISCADMRRYVPQCLARGERVDLLFSNSLVYLEADEVTPFLAQCRELCSYFHFLSSTSESFEPNDRHRRTLRPRKWWRTRFIDAGFAPTRSPYVFR